MSQNLLKTFAKTLIASSLIFGFCDVVNAKKISEENSKFIFEGNKNLELCKELNQILKEPENQKLIKPADIFNYTPKYGTYIPKKYKFVSAEFFVPEKYKKFRLPVWRGINSDELTKYLSSETLEKVSKLSSPQMTQIDLDHDGKSESVFRFLLKETNSWRCYVSDVESKSLAQDFDKFRSVGKNECYFFYYDGMPYKASQPENYILVETPKSSPSFGFTMLEACLFFPK